MFCKKQYFDVYVFFLIFIALLFAHSPVLWGEYLRQDDWNAAFWNVYNPVSHPEFYNSAIELFRPISTIFILMGDYIAHHIEYATYVRLFNIFLLSIASYLTYLWQIKFSPDKKFFAVSFALMAFCLPSSQLHSSTVSYGNMVFSIICGQAAAFYSARLFLAKNDKEERTRDYLYGALFIFLGSLNYALSSMFYFVFLLMFYLTNLKTSDLKENIRNIKFVLKSAAFIFLVMGAYIVLAKVLFFVFGIVPRNLERSVSIDWDIIQKLKHILAMFKQSFNLFDIAGYFKFNQWYSFIVITSFLFVSLGILSCQKYDGGLDSGKTNYLNSFFCFVITSVTIFVLLIFAYAPALAPRPIFSTFRYLAVTMPFALYILFWALGKVFDGALFAKKSKKMSCSIGESKIRKIIYTIITLFGLLLCNHNLFNYIVGPHLHEMNYLRSAIELKALKNIEKNGKTTIYVIKNTGRSYAKNQHASYEYGFSINFSHNWLVSAVTYLMRQYGYDSISGRRFDFARWDDEVIHLKTPWGNIISAKNAESVKVEDDDNVVIINMNHLGVYR